MIDPVEDAHLCDTNILLRVGRELDPSQPAIEGALIKLQNRGVKLLYTLQNIAEFWNTCTRPADRKGFGYSIAETESAVVLIESNFALLTETPETYSRWRQLVRLHAVRGVQVHDARLVATMQSNGISKILTLNGKDFRRYDGITAVHPAEV